MPRLYKNLTRIFVENNLKINTEIELAKEPSNHLINVLRKKTGDEIIIFNGVNGAWLANIITAKKNKTTIMVVKQIAEQPPSSDIWYGFAPLKKARLDYMIQKATEMGVAYIQPVFTQYTQVNKLKTDKLKTYMLEAAQQCEILSLPEIEPSIKLKDLLENWQKTHGERVLILADETKKPTSPITILETLKDKKLGLLIGPEGGFSDEELKLLHKQNFVVPISLGKNILRADTAAVAALAFIQAIIVKLR